MKKYILFIIVIAASSMVFYSCQDMNKFTKEYWGETVYPAKYDTVIGHIGFERVEIDLMKAGRIPSKQINMGKAIKTVIEYDDKQIVMDSLVSWVNIKGLTQSKIYRFDIYTLDEFGNKSVPQEIALIPFTSSDLASTVINSPRITLSPSSAIVDWPSGLNSILLNYFGLTYQYTNRDGATVKGERGADSRFFVANLETGKPATVKMSYKILPKVDNVSILDTLYLNRDLIINIPTGTETFSPVERDVLIANGLTKFDFESASKITKLVYPVQANSLQDIFYFSNIQELDLTGGSLFQVKQYTYSRNNATSVVGGGDFLPFIAKVVNVNDVQVLKDLLESGTLKKVHYTPGTMGLDNLLAPYVSSGVVELTSMPDDVLIPYNFRVDGNVQTGDFNINVTQNPSDAPAGTGLQYVYKMIPKGKSASFILALPPDYRYNALQYPYIKFRVYAPSVSALSAPDRNFNQIWIRLMTSIWGSFPGESNFGQEEYSSPPRPTVTIADSDLQKWTEYSYTTSAMLTRHTRVIVFNIGNEAGNTPSKDLTFFFANIRLSKTP